MTGKQALEKLNYECIRTNGVDDESSKEYKIIRKDLEVLEILKKYLEIIECESYEDACKKIVLEIPDQRLIEEDDEGNEDIYPIEDFYEVKEWLENAN